MFNWDSCPIDLFDLYIEVGEVKKSKTEYDGCVCIELWIKSTFSNTCVREECKNPIRRPVFGVLKQIRKLCDDKPVCLMIMGDDNSNAVMHWGSVIA
ncbi:MAG: hypothetical protein II342_00540, partial [Clostridia bacterium]|nr:hypothetical protein [Clostridia bacterium]